MSRFLFPFGSRTAPTGGRNVMLSMIDVLNDAGHSAHPVYPRADQEYRFFDSRATTFHDPRLATLERRSGRGGGVADRLALVRRQFGRQGSLHKKLELVPDDIVVVPEFRYPELGSLYQGQRRVLLAQDVMGFARAQLRDRKSQTPELLKFHAVVTTSEAAHRGVRELAGIDGARTFLALDAKEFQYTAEKRMQIAVMPRKHPVQAEIVVNALRSDPGLSDVSFVILQGMSRQELLQRFSESLFFLSFSKEEGFGLPPAEAMATGSIVIGYRGVGAVEYFDETTGFPVDADDISAFIATTRRLVEQYRRDPGPLDAFRRSASDRILGFYTADRFRESTLRAFEEVANQRLSS